MNAYATLAKRQIEVELSGCRRLTLRQQVDAVLLTLEAANERAYAGTKARPASLVGPPPRSCWRLIPQLQQQFEGRRNLLPLLNTVTAHAELLRLSGYLQRGGPRCEECGELLCKVQRGGGRLALECVPCRVKARKRSLSARRAEAASA